MFPITSFLILLYRYCEMAELFSLLGNSGAPTRATWLTEGTYVRTYASTDCTGGVGATIKRKGRVSQACLAKSTSFTLDIHNMVNWQLSKQDSHWPVSITISRAHVSTHWGDVIYLEVIRWQVNYFSSVSYFLASLGSEHRKTDTHIGQQCCDKLTAVKTRYPLTSIT